jgi:ATP-dependent Lon protease
MTGEIDLKGNIWPIGGLKEKLISAKAEGITTVFIPEGNKADLTQLDASLIDGLTVVQVGHIKTILDQIFE